MNNLTSLLVSAAFLILAPFSVSALHVDASAEGELKSQLQTRLENLKIGLASLVHRNDADVGVHGDVKSEASVRANHADAGVNASANVHASGNLVAKHDADDDEDADKNDNDDRDRNDSQREHNALPRGIEKRIEDGKDIPRGILMRFFGKDKEDKDDGHATTTKDSAAPLIFAIRAATGSTTAEVRWFTNEKTTGYVKYGTTTSLGATTTVESSAGWMHHVTLSGLTPDTLYHYSIVATDTSGNVRETAVLSFKTKVAVSAELDTTPPRILFATVLNVSTDSARILWITNEETKGTIFLGTSTTVGTTTPLMVKNDLSFFHEARLEGLASNTVYFYAIQSTDKSGNVTSSAEASFTTRTK